VGAVSHSLFGGIGVAMLLQRTCDCCSWLSPWYGALLAGLVAAGVIAWGSDTRNTRKDTVLSAIWAIGMAIGITCIAAIPGYPPDLNSYLFGSILIVGKSDLVLMGVLDGILVVASLLLHHRFVALAFNPEQLLLRGISPRKIALVLELLIAMTIVVISQLVGIILCMALLILPAATACGLHRKIRSVMFTGGVICGFCAFLGIALSYDVLPGTTLIPPTGATIIELAGLTYLGATLIRKYRS